MRALILTFFVFQITAPLTAQMPPVGRIEVFGHPGARERIRSALADLEGRPVPSDLKARADSLEALHGLDEVGIDAVCCDGGLTTLYVAVRADDVSGPRFRDAPDGHVRLPHSIVALGERFDHALEDAVRRGAVAEDHSAGHALMQDSAARRVQEEFIRIAASEDSLVRAVLAESEDAAHRALAAQVLSYSPEKQGIVAPLLAAARDPDPTVRNESIRSLWILASWTGEHPGTGIHIPPEPFIDLLHSVAWTDRNKAAMVLMQLSSTRDSALIAALRGRAFDPLVDMARWADMGHAFPGVVMLGRIAGLTEESIFAALSQGRKDQIVDAALRSRAPGT